jgi:hypothetical protein
LALHPSWLRRAKHRQMLFRIALRVWHEWRLHEPH